MISTIKIIFSLTVLSLLFGCSENKPIQTTTGSITVKPQITANRPSFYSHPPRLPGQWTVNDILQDYSTFTMGKLNPYFTKANVAYPPKEVTLIALKKEKKLELWARDNGEFRYIRNYKIQAASGVAGPKLRQGDKQVPEGIYRISGLNPNSHYHLSMKINYPNEFDLMHAKREGRFTPGSDIFIHGKAVSIGCLAIGDDAIDELFVLTALVGKENVKVLIAPHDPRTTPLRSYSKLLPTWTPELYAIISQEMRPFNRR